MNSKKAFLLILTILTLSTAASAEQLLRLNLEEDQRFYQRMTQQQQIEQQMMGQTMTFNQDSGFGWIIEVTEVDDDGAMWLETTYDWVMIEMDGMGMSFSYDSAVDDEEEVSDMVKGFASMLGLTFKTKVNNRGEVLDIEGFEKMREKFAEQLAGGPMEEAMLESMDQYLDEDMLRQYMGYSIAFYPEQAVSVGDSWRDSMVMPGPFEMKADYEYTVNEISDDRAVLGIAGTMATDDAAGLPPGMPEGMDFDLEGTINGTGNVDLTTGLTSESNLDMDMSIEMTMPGGPNGQPMTMPMSIKGTIRSTIEPM